MKKLLLISIISFSSVFAPGPLVGLDLSLRKASLNGNVNDIKDLLAAGANIESSDNTLLHTPLFSSVFRGHVDAAKALLAAGANKEAVDNFGGTPLHLASLNGHVDIVKALLHAGANKEAVDNKGNTPLHLVLGTRPHLLSKKHVDAAKALLDAGANKENIPVGLNMSGAMSRLLHSYGPGTASDKNNLFVAVVKEAFDKYKQGKPELLARILGGVIDEKKSWLSNMFYYLKSKEPLKKQQLILPDSAIKRARNLFDQDDLEDNIIPKLKEMIPGLKIESNAQIAHREAAYLNRARLKQIEPSPVLERYNIYKNAF